MKKYAIKHKDRPWYMRDLKGRDKTFRFEFMAKREYNDDSIIPPDHRHLYEVVIYEAEARV